MSSRPAPARSTARWGRRLAAPVAVSVLVALLGPANAAAAAVPTADELAGSNAVVGLRRLAVAFGGAGTLAELNTDLPLTDVSPRDVLKLDTELGRQLDAAVTAQSPALSDLASVVSTSPALDMSELPASSSGVHDWTLHVDLTGSSPLPLRFDDGRLRFGAAEARGSLASRMVGDLHLRYDPKALGLRQFSVVGDAPLTVTTWTRASGATTFDLPATGADLEVAAFDAVDGFVKTSVAGDYRAKTQTVLRLRDPDGRGALTTEDLQFGSAPELFALTSGPGLTDVTSTLTESTSLLPGETGKIQVGKTVGASQVYPAPAFTRTAGLELLTSLTRGQAVGGFSQFASALASAEGSVDTQLPLLETTTSDLFSPGRDLTDLLGQQATARIVCGAADTTPPSGAPRPGQVRYCEALTDSLSVDTDTAVTWAGADGANVTGDAAGTVGASPTGNVRVTGGGGFPRLTVTFTSGGTVRTARSLVSSVQELSAVVGDIGLGGDLAYDPVTHTLRLRVHGDPADKTVHPPTGGAADLTSLTGLAGLCQASGTASPRHCPQTGDELAPGTTPEALATGDATVTATGQHVDATFGLEVVPATTLVAGDEAAATPVVFVQAGADGVLYEIGTVTASIDDLAPLAARLGFLQTDVDLKTYSLDAPAGGGPAVQVVLNATGTPVVLGGTTVTGAVRVEDVVETPSALTATRGLRAKAHLDVRDGVIPGTTTRPLDADGTVDATWASLDPDVQPTVVTGGRYDDLRLLDLVPAQQGIAGAGSTGATLVDPTAHFARAFGVDVVADVAARTVSRPVRDLDAVLPSGGIADSARKTATCASLLVDSETSLTCLDAAFNGFTAGHRYQAEGDPTALRDALLDDLTDVLATFADPTAKPGQKAPDAALATSYARTFPLVDVRPDQASTAGDQLSKAVAHLIDLAAKDDGVGEVSTLQGFAKAVSSQVTSAATTLALVDRGGVPHLDVHVGNASKDLRLDAPLKLSVGDQALRIYGGVDSAGAPAPATVPLKASSSADVDVSVDLTTGDGSVGTQGTSLSQSLTGFVVGTSAVKESLAGMKADFGSSAVTTGSASELDLGLGVKAVTKPKTDAAPWIPVKDLLSSLQQSRARSGTETLCGSDAAVAGCAVVPVSAATATTTVRVALKADESSGGSGAGLTTAPLAYSFLADAVSALPRTLSQALDGDLAGQALPLLGTDLDGGADVPSAVGVWAAAARKALSVVDDGESATATVLVSHVKTALGSPGHTVVGAATLTCGGSPCATDATVADLDELRVPLTLSGTATGESAFRPGLAGLSLDTDRTVPTSTDWKLAVTVGIQRGTGPFLLLGTPGSDPTKVLTSHVTAKLPTFDAKSCHAWTRSGAWATKVNSRTPGTAPAVPLADSAGARCLDVLVGKLPATLVDLPSAGDQGAVVPGTHVDATVAVALSSVTDVADSAGRLFLPALFDRKAPFTTSVTGSGGMDVYFEGFAGDLGFFDVLGRISLSWTPPAADGTGGFGDPTFRNLLLDAKTVYTVLDAGYGKARAALAPLNPVVDVLTAPIPVISDIAKAVGADPVTALSILARGVTNVRFVLALLEFQQLLAKLPGSGSDTELVSLGGDDSLGGRFTLDKASVQYNTCAKTFKIKGGGPTYTNTKKEPGDAGRCDPGLGSKVKKAVGKTGAQGPADPDRTQATQKRMKRNAYFGLPSISVPVLEDSANVYKLLYGTGDTTLLRVDLGTAGITQSYSKIFGPFMIGPVPVVAQIGIGAGFEARFAFGFDTHALTDQIDQLDHVGDVENLRATPRGGVFADGFYVDDLDAQGNDVPEIKFTLTVFAGAQVELGFAEAGLNGGAIFDISLDAFDPNGDGKVRADEFAGTGGITSCAFDVSSGVQFFLEFYFHLDLFLFNLDKRYDIVRSPRLKIFDFQCAPAVPVLATYTGGTSPTLRLTAGDPTTRSAYKDVSKDVYTVRQLKPDANDTTQAGKALLEVSAFGIVQDFPVDPKTVVVADSNADDDTLRFYPGQMVTRDSSGATTVTTQRFVQDVHVDAGAGNDKVTTGSGNDVVDGGAGNDTLDGSAGNDTLDGQAGTDSVNGGAGDDHVSGGAGDDALQGGAGADVVHGGSGNDTLLGGNGTDPGSLFPTTSEGVIAAQLDSGDAVIGDAGADTVDGSDGSDLVVGGSLTAEPTLDGTTTTKVVGVDPTGKIQNVAVLHSTVALPTRAAVLQECADSGTATTDGGDVVTGGPDGDMVVGGPGPDDLSGGAGSDLVCGRAGDDSIIGDGVDVPAKDQGADELLGGPGRDRMHGGGGKDTLDGGAGDDLLRGGDGDDALSGGTGSDLELGEAGLDTLYGATKGDDGDNSTGSGRDITCTPTTSIVSGGVDLTGDLSANGADAGQLEGYAVVGGLVQGPDGKPLTGLVGGRSVLGGRFDLDGNGVTATTTGGDAPVTTLDAGDTGAVDLAGLTGAGAEGDCLLGGADPDTLLDGQGGGDLVDAGDGDDLAILGGAGDDLVRGGAGNDVVDGNAGNDLVVGDTGDDLVRAGQGDDVVRGGEGDDLLIGGGGQAGVEDGTDELLGGTGRDVLAGDNATMARPSATDPTPAVPAVVQLLATTASASGLGDQLFGGFGNDWAFGQDGADTVRGGQDDDVVEGGPGNDTVQGDDGNDLLVGGSSVTYGGTADGSVTPTRNGAAMPDGDDVLLGDAGPDGKDGSDVLAGDDAVLTPGLSGPTVQLVPGTAAAGTSGADTLRGGGAADRLYGEDGTDTLSGGDGPDVLEGGSGADTLRGEAGDDALVGGGSDLKGLPGDASDGNRLPDVGDDLDGGTGDDVLAGDNARLVPVSGTRADGTAKRAVQLFDVHRSATVSSSAADGPDLLTGGPGRDLLFGQGGTDTLSGGDDDDVLEGGSGTDTLSGDGGQDDLLGGGSASDGAVITATTDRLFGNVSGLTDASAAGLVDSGDVLWGGSAATATVGTQPDGADVLLGDNGRITRPGKDAVAVVGNPVERRTVAMADTVPGAWSGNDTLHGGAGDDDLYGQFGGPTPNVVPVVQGASATATAPLGDVLYGDEGDDALVGDQGADVPTPALTVGKPTTLTTSAGFVSEPVLASGSTVRVVTLAQPTVGDPDLLLGGPGDDVLHAGAGADYAEAGAGDDAVFGDDGVDRVWGGTGHDRLFGGAGGDFLDLKPRVEDGPAAAALAPRVDSDGLKATVNDRDTVYGGDGPDAMQGDTGDAGRTLGDRLIDWYGIYNISFVCNGSYGAGKVLVSPDPSTVSMLQNLTTDVGGSPATGAGELALTTSGNTSPTYPGAPGHFVCETG